MKQEKCNIWSLALTGGIYFGLVFAVSTLLALFKVPGFVPFTTFLESLYGPYGYSLSWMGVLVGAGIGFWGGIIHVGLFAWIYFLLRCKE